MHPDEACSWSGIDASAAEVAGSSGDDASNEQSDNNSGGFHDRATVPLTDEDGDEDGEAEADKLSTTPRKGMGGTNLRAKAEYALFWSRGAGTTPASPVLEAGFDQIYANESDCWTGNEWREKLLQKPRGCETHQDFKKRAAALRSENSTCDKLVPSYHQRSCCATHHSLLGMEVHFPGHQMGRNR